MFNKKKCAASLAAALALAGLLTGTVWAAITEGSATGEYALAIGEGSDASGYWAVAIGSKAKDEDGKEIATKAAAGMGVAVGAGAQAGTTVGKYDSKNNRIGDWYSTAVGSLSKAGDRATAIGASSNASDYATAAGYKSNASGYGGTALGTESTASGYYSVAAGSNSLASGHYSIAIGGGEDTDSGAKAKGYGSIAIGTNAETEYIPGTDTNGTPYGLQVAIGEDAKATGNQAVAYGKGAQATDQYASAYGAASRATASGATALGYGAYAKGAASTASGAESYAAGETSSAFGYRAAALADNATALGSYSVANEANEVSFGHSVGDKYHYKDENGNDKEGTYTEELTRKLTHVAPGMDDTDGVNVSQLRATEVNIAGNSLAIHNLGSEIDSVGAISAALAGLHPLDYDGEQSKWQLSAAYGSYDGTSALAFGGFYHANEDTLFSGGFSSAIHGKRKTAFNVGLTFRVGSGNEEEVSSVEARALAAENKKLKAQVAEQKEELAARTQQLSKQARELDAQEKIIAAQQREMDKLATQVKALLARLQ